MRRLAPTGPETRRQPRRRQPAGHHPTRHVADQGAEPIDAISLPDARLDTVPHERRENVLGCAALRVGCARARHPKLEARVGGEAGILTHGLEEEPTAIVVSGRRQLVVASRMPPLERHRRRRDELMGAPVCVALPDPADNLVPREAAKVRLQDVPKLVRDDRRALEHRTRIDDEVSPSVGPAVGVLG